MDRLAQAKVIYFSVESQFGPVTYLWYSYFGLMALTWILLNHSEDILTQSSENRHLRPCTSLVWYLLCWEPSWISMQTWYSTKYLPGTFFRWQYGPVSIQMCFVGWFNQGLRSLVSVQLWQAKACIRLPIHLLKVHTTNIHASHLSDFLVRPTTVRFLFRSHSVYLVCRFSVSDGTDGIEKFCMVTTQQWAAGL